MYYIYTYVIMYIVKKVNYESHTKLVHHQFSSSIVIYSVKDCID